MRVGHVTDLHVHGHSGVSPWRFANKRLTGWANLRFHRGAIHKTSIARSVLESLAADGPDHVIVTGDLTNLALEPEFELAGQLIEALGLPPERVSVVPGNHDVYTAGSFRARRFEGFFGKHITSELSGSGAYPFVRLQDGIAVIGLSSAVPRLPFVAAGRIGRDQLAALGRVVAEPALRERFPIVLVHHPPYNAPSPLKARLEGLDDADLLEAALAPLGRGLVAHGHLHRRIHRRRGPLQVVGATSASLDSADPDRMAGYNLYEIEGGVLVRVTARVLDAPGGRFREIELPVS
ncbi:MAG: metallophosphoesterase [Deltaproteobacteria bacterium]|nr:metallophosphoesterase [Deltaproteobacteria bacterium]